MTRAEAIVAAVTSLTGRSDSPRIDAELLLGHVCHESRAGLLAWPEIALSATEQAQFDALLDRRAAGEPVAYLTGRRDFHAVELAVTPDVLVPRPETELLVEICLGLPRRGSILDLGTGSGAIAIALARALDAASVVAVDIDPAAAAVARGNAQAAGVRVDVRVSDWFGNAPPIEFDIIVGNPPYIRSGDPHFDGPLRHEPRLALDGGADGLDCYRSILAGAPAFLGAHGLLVLEHGYDQRDALAALAADFGFAIRSQSDDLAGLPRAIVLGIASPGAGRNE